MIASLQKFDKIVAAGILARAALALENAENPAAAPAVPDEQKIRAEILESARKAVGSKPADDSVEAVQRVGDFLDSERERLLGGTNSERALLALSAKGALPSDLYVVSIIPNISQYLGRAFEVEKKLIEETVRSPDQEQHYGESANALGPFLISLFAKTFHDKYPERSFTMLVAGERQGFRFVVHQAWRLYPGQVDVSGAHDLIDMLRRFADVYGMEVEVGDQRGKFILLGDIPDSKPIPNTIKVTNKKKRPSLFTCTFFRQQWPQPGDRKAALVLAIDLDSYREMLKTKSKGSPNLKVGGHEAAAAR